MTKFLATRQLRSLAPPAWVAPVANADSVAGGVVGQAMTITGATLLANDTHDSRGTLAIQSVQAPVGCTVALNSSAQTITVTPVQVTPVSFQYTLVDTNAFTASATVTLPSVTAAPPPSGQPQKVIGPPQLTNPTVVQITNAANNAQATPGKWILNSGTDYRIQFMEVITSQVRLVGGNKVHVGWGPTPSDYGGEISVTTINTVLIVEDMQSECWIEGMVCRKNATQGFCFQIRCVTTAFPVWILNCFADQPMPVNTGGGGAALCVHDGICPKITIDGFTIVTYGTGISRAADTLTGTYSQLVCNRVYAHWATNPARLVGILYEVPATASFTDCWAVDDTTPSTALSTLVSGVTIGTQTFATLGLRGVQAQFDEGWDPAILDNADSTNIDPTFVRDNFLRPLIELSPGVYDFSRMDAALTKIQSKGQKFTMIAFYGANVWDGDFAGFARFTVDSALHVLATFPGVLAAIEVWNEPDGNWPVSPTDYVTMFTAIRNSVRAQPSLNNIPLVGPALYGPSDLSYWNAVISAGFLALVDIVSVHIYGGPEDLLTFLPAFQTAMASNPKPIWISEWGAYSSTAPKGESARTLSIMKSLGIAQADYFPLRDYAPFPDSGLLTTTGTIKAQGTNFIGWYTNIGDSATYVGRDSLNTVAYSFIFNKAGTTVRHLWATIDTHILIDGVATLLTATPIYLTGSHTVVIDPAFDQLLASIQGDFTVAGQSQPFRYLSRLNDDSSEVDMIVGGVDRWVRSGASNCFIRSDTVCAPEISFKAVVRWIVPSGVPRIKIFGGFTRAQSGADGTNCRVLRNSTVLFSKLPLQQSDGTVLYTLIKNVVAGDKIEFEIGSGGVDNSFDDTFSNFYIYATSDPVN